MNCVNPLFLKSQDIYVPCGKCLFCRMTKAREWAFRISHEFETFNHVGSFITLTYNDVFLPFDTTYDPPVPVLIKSHLQNFFKLLRKRFKGTLKYFACGEYGGRFGRPHYHSILIGVSPDWLHSQAIPGTAFRAGNGFNVLTTLWYDYLADKLDPENKGKNFRGFMNIEPVVPSSISYVCGYEMKKINVDGNYPKGAAPFQLQSQGIGFNYAVSHFDQFIERYTFWNGKKIGIPRYYRKKIGTSQDVPVSELLEIRRKYEHACDIHNADKMEYYRNRLDELDADNSYRRLLERKLLERYNLKK